MRGGSSCGTQELTGVFPCWDSPMSHNLCVVGGKEMYFTDVKLQF